MAAEGNYDQGAIRDFGTTKSISDIAKCFKHSVNCRRKGEGEEV